MGIAIIGIGIAVIYFFRDFIGQEKYIKEYVKEYKKEIISNFVKSISDKFNYRVDKIAYLQELNDYGLANFDNKKFNNYEADDYIEGNIDENSFFKMCEMHIQYIDNSRNTIENLFKGIFANIQSDRDIGTYIKITRDKLKIKSREDKVEMDSPEFEKYFDVYAEDKIMAMRILTADIMECLINFYNKYKLEFDIVFSGSNIYVRFFTGVMFEPKIYKNSMDKEILLEYYSILKFILELNQKVNKATQEIDI